MKKIILFMVVLLFCSFAYGEIYYYDNGNTTLNGSVGTPGLSPVDGGWIKQARLNTTNSLYLQGNMSFYGHPVNATLYLMINSTAPTIGVVRGWSSSDTTTFNTFPLRFDFMMYEDGESNTNCRAEMVNTGFSDELLLGRDSTESATSFVFNDCRGLNLSGVSAVASVGWNNFTIIRMSEDNNLFYINQQLVANSTSDCANSINRVALTSYNSPVNSTCRFAEIYVCDSVGSRCSAQLDPTINICTAGDVLINISGKEENNRTPMNLDISGVINIKNDLGLDLNQTVNRNDTNNILICDGNARTSSQNFYYSAYFQHSGDGGITERHYIYNSTTNTSNINLIDLYNFGSATGLSTLTANLLTYYYDFYPNVNMRLQRYYPNSNVWIEVQNDRSDDSGQGVFYVYQEYVDYRFLWVLNGTALDLQSNGASTNALKFLCDTSTECEETFIVSLEEDADRLSGFIHNITYNNVTGIILLSWADANSATDNVRLLVEIQKGNRIVTVCNTTTSAASGAITCDVSAQNGLITAVGFRTASPNDPFAVLLIDKITRALRDVLTANGRQQDGVFFAFLIMAGAAGFGAFSAVATVIIGIVGLIMLFTFGIASFVTVSFVVGGIFLGAIVAYMVNK